MKREDFIKANPVKCFAVLVIALCLHLFSLNAYPQLPQLSLPLTLTGVPTSAVFYGGASADEGISYGLNFSPDQVIDVQLKVQVEASHVETTGSLFLVAEVDKQLFMRDDNGTYLTWDGTLDSLLPTATNILLSDSETVTVADKVALTSIGVVDAQVYIYLAYSTDASPGELYYTGTPLRFLIEDGPDQLSSFGLFTENISEQIIQSRCINCHTSGGIAGVTALVYSSSGGVDYQLNNFNRLFEYVRNAPSGTDFILTKPQGLSAHGGGVQLAASSLEYDRWSQFVASLKADIADSGEGGRDIFANVRTLGNRQTLRKASLLFAGRLPTDSELLGIESASTAELKSAIRKLMTGDRFHQFLTESANDRLLTKFLRYSLFVVVNPYYYPESRRFLDAAVDVAEFSRVSEAIADEPLELIAHVVENERPYTEVLTADYIMVNPYSAIVYGGDVVFDNTNDPDEWRQGRITEYYRCAVCTGPMADASYEIPTDYPHAGLLNSPAFLARFPSSDTNRNRARSRWVNYFFLGLDIEGLSARTTDQSALTDENNPTLNNPNCTVCHDIMDPVAGAFQNYDDLGFYKSQPGGGHSLPWSYILNPFGGYQIGDVWYRDMLAPGLGQLLAPSSNNSLQWLAQQLVTDSRFGYGTAYFWYPAVMGRDPYAKPENPEDSDYQFRLAAYNAEQAMMRKVATDFVNGVAGNGDHNLKDLLVALVMSNHFRAESISLTNPAQEAALAGIGSGKLLTPEQLNRKLIDTTGYEWAYGDFNALVEVYNLIYGGIDSFTVTQRATELTTLMSSVVAAMANETSCSIVSQEFGLPASARKLFNELELSVLPTAEPVAIRRTIQHLHKQLLGEELVIGDVEIEATYQLFEQVWTARVAANKSGVINTVDEICNFGQIANPVEYDAAQTLRSWVAVVNYLLRDYKFIHE